MHLSYDMFGFIRRWRPLELYFRLATRMVLFCRLCKFCSCPFKNYDETMMKLTKFHLPHLPKNRHIPSLQPSFGSWIADQPRRIELLFPKGLPTHESVEFTHATIHKSYGVMKTQRTSGEQWTHNKSELTTWAWISKPISPEKRCCQHINRSSEESDTYSIPWNMLKVEKNINHIITTWHCNWIIHLGLSWKNHSDLTYIAHQLVLYISMSCQKKPASKSTYVVPSPFRSLCNSGCVFSPIPQCSSASFIVCFGPRFNALLAARSKATVFKPRGRGSNSWREKQQEQHKT